MELLSEFSGARLYFQSSGIFGMADSTDLPQNNIKVVTVGEAGTGKTSILRYFCLREPATESIEPTIAHDQLTRDFTVKNNVYRLTCWDTSGTERYRGLVPAYLRNATFVLIVVSLIDRDSLEKLEYWTDFVRQHLDDPLIALVANKTDLEPHLITEEELIEAAAPFDGRYFVTSAFTGEGAEAVLEDMVSVSFTRSGCVITGLPVVISPGERSCC
jgi:small GTP-binding protein